MHSNGTALAVVTVTEETVLVPAETFTALASGLATLRQAVKDTITDLAPGLIERDMLEMLRSLDTASSFLGFAARKAARGDS